MDSFLRSTAIVGKMKGLEEKLQKGYTMLGRQVYEITNYVMLCYNAQTFYIEYS